MEKYQNQKMEFGLMDRIKLYVGTVMDEIKGTMDNLRKSPKAKVAVVGAGLLTVSGCVNRQAFDYTDHLLKPMEQIIAESPAYNNTKYFLQDSPEGKSMKSVSFHSDIVADATLKGNSRSISAVFNFKEGTESGYHDVAYKVNYTDGTSEMKVAKINFQAEGGFQRGSRLYTEDREALSNLVMGIYSTPEGKRLSTVIEEGGIYTPRKDFVRIENHELDKDGLRAEANMDFQDNLDNLVQGLFGKPVACYRNEVGELMVMDVTGILERLDYSLKQAAGVVSNGTETVVQQAAVNDGLAQVVAGTSDVVDAGTEFVATNSLLMGGQVRTGYRTINIILGSENEIGKKLAKEAKNPYFWRVRESGFRGIVEAVGSVTIGSIQYNIFFNPDGGGSGSTVIAEGPVDGGTPPAKPAGW